MYSQNRTRALVIAASVVTILAVLTWTGCVSPAPAPVQSSQPDCPAPVVETKTVTVTQVVRIPITNTVTIHDAHYGGERTPFSSDVQSIATALGWFAVTTTDESRLGGACTWSGNGMCEPFLTFVPLEKVVEPKAYLVYAQWVGKENGVGFFLSEKTAGIPSFNPVQVDQVAAAKAFGYEFPPVSSGKPIPSDKLFVLPIKWWPLSELDVFHLQSLESGIYAIN